MKKVLPYSVINELQKINPMISLVSNWWIVQGNEAKVLPALKELAANVKAHEPGTLMYTVHFPNFGDGISSHTSRPVPRPGAVIFVESYQDWDAFDAHVEGPIFKKFVGDYGHYFVQSEKGGPYTGVVFMDRIAGFTPGDK